MRNWTSKLLEPLFGGFRRWLPNSIPHVSTIDAEGHDEKDCQEKQGADSGTTDKAVLEELSAKIKSLQSFSNFRIHPGSINFNSATSRGSGGKAEVVQATFERGLWNGKEQVAVKKLRCCDTINKHQASYEFINEVQVMAGLVHENIVRFIGFVEDFEHGKAWVVLSWEANGNVREFLATGQWEIPERLSLIKDTVAGLQYLHTRQPPICHGDLKSLNILVSSSYKAMITDFGSAQFVPDSQPDESTSQEMAANSTPRENYPLIHLGASGNRLTLTGPAWSIRWAPPEFVNGNRPDLPGDIWAVGWVCWEIMTDKLPFSELSSPDAITTMVIEGNVPSAHEDPQLSQIIALSNLMADCWALNPKDRPTISKCSREIKWMPSTPPSGGKSDSKTPSIDLLLQIGHIHYNQGNYENAASLFLQGLAAARLADDQKAIAQALEWLGSTYHLQCRYSEAEESFTQSQEIYRRIDNDLGLANTLNGLGKLQRFQCRYIEAQDLFTRAQDIYARIGEERGQAAALVGLGHVYRALSKHAEAEESYTKAKDISLRVGDYQTQGNSLRGLGLVYSKQSKYTEAEEFFIQARDIYSRIGDFLGQGNMLFGLGGIYQLQSKYVDAGESFTRALDLYARVNNLRGQANTFNALGSIYRAQSRYSEAEELHARAQEIFSRIGDVRGQASALRSLGHIRRHQNRYADAGASYTEARDLYAKLGLSALEEDMSRRLAAVSMRENAA